MLHHVSCIREVGVVQSLHCFMTKAPYLHLLLHPILPHVHSSLHQAASWLVFQLAAVALIPIMEVAGNEEILLSFFVLTKSWRCVLLPVCASCN